MLVDKSTLPILEVLDDEEEINRRYAIIMRQEAEAKAAKEAETERLKQVANAKERTPYDAAIAADICERIAEGGVLKDVCAEREDFPSLRQAKRWIRGNAGFAARYQMACEERLEAWEDDILILADDMSRDRVEKIRGKVETDSAAVARSKLQIEARKALLRANNPTKWGEAITVVNPEPQDMFADMSLERIEELARAAELEELVEQKKALDRENEQRRAKGETLLDFAAFLALQKGS